MSTDQSDRIMSPSWVSIPIKNEKDETISVRLLRYDHFVLKLWKKMDFDKMLGHAGRGIADEAGEINSCIKKHLDYEQEFNLENLIEEIGDMKFYLMALQNMFGLTDALILQKNAEKLATRYANLEYSDGQAKLRRDKNGDS